MLQKIINLNQLFLLLLTSGCLGVVGSSEKIDVSAPSGAAAVNIPNLANVKSDTPIQMELSPRITSKKGALASLTMEEYNALWSVSQDRGPIPPEYLDGVINTIRSIPRPIDRSKLIKYGLLAEDIGNISSEEKQRRLQRYEDTIKNMRQREGG